VVRIALGQLNTTVGDLDGNVALMSAWAARAADADADLICFPELAITGYPPEDLVLRTRFVSDGLDALEKLAADTADVCAVLVGFVDRSERGLHNAAALLRGGRVEERYHKVQLPNFGVFDEKRYFVPGHAACTVRVASSDLGLSVCEDAWHGEAPFDTYARTHPQVILNINGSPYHHGKGSERLEICRERGRQTGAWIVYVNAVGGQDELVFDGGSMVVSPSGDVAARGAMFEEDLVVVEIAPDGGVGPIAPWPTGPEDVYWALVLGLGDYVRKNGFREVVVGLSGGIDSALVATLAADELGLDVVRTVTMPSPYSSPESVEDAEACARRLGVRFDVMPITEVFDSYRSMLAGELAGTGGALAQENIQARIRGNVLMAISNTFGSLVLATGNKSEYAVGYATLYGDMAGGFAPIKDCSKLMVYRLARYRNSLGRVIPERSIERAPSAELRPDQKDTDSLPPYEVMDPILEAFIEADLSVDEITARGFDRATVGRVLEMVKRNEYKRRQAPPGIRISGRAFGRDWRYPITSGYKSR